MITVKIEKNGFKKQIFSNKKITEKSEKMRMKWITVGFRFASVAMNIPLTGHFDAFDSPFVYHCRCFVSLAKLKGDGRALAWLPNSKSNTARTRRNPAWSWFITRNSIGNWNQIQNVKLSKKRTKWNVKEIQTALKPQCHAKLPVWKSKKLEAHRTFGCSRHWPVQSRPPNKWCPAMGWARATLWTLFYTVAFRPCSLIAIWLWAP